MTAAGRRASRTEALRRAAAVAVLCAAAAGTVRADVAPSGLRVVGDGVPEPVAALPGDAARGRALVVARDHANCVLCHAVPEPTVRFSGNVGPSLAGIGGRLTAAQLRLRVADNLRVNPDTVMPSYYRVAGLDRVAPQYAGRPILSAAEVEDLVAYLSSLR
jgi:L-cysteine S-thiosulfotransferase